MYELIVWSTGAGVTLGLGDQGEAFHLLGHIWAIMGPRVRCGPRDHVMRHAINANNLFEIIIFVKEQKKKWRTRYNLKKKILNFTSNSL